MNRCAVTVVLIMYTAIASAMSPPDRVAQTLDVMENAVLEADAGSFMTQIDTSDPIFVTEQRAWFADLDRNPVSSFQIEPLEKLIVGITDQAAMMHLRFHWTLKSDGIKRTIEFNALFVPMADEPDGPWLFSGRGWEIKLQSEDGLRVLADRQHNELATNVLKVVPDIQHAIERALGQSLSQPLTIKVYPTVQELQYSIAPGYINPISGWNEPGESIKILGRDNVSAERISSLLAHEIGHAVSFEYGPDIDNAPWWSLEGIAELVADEYRSTPPEERIIAVAKQVERGDRKTWEQLSDFRGEAVNHSMYVYSQGWSMARYITQRYGKRARNEWFTLLCNSTPLEEATQRALGISFEDLDMEWEAEMISIAQQADD